MSKDHEQPHLPNQNLEDLTTEVVVNFQRAFPDEILEPRLIDVFKSVDRKYFLSSSQQQNSYVNSQVLLREATDKYPYASVASRPELELIMLHFLNVKPGQKVLEVGTGSGHVAAMLYELTREENPQHSATHVHSIDYDPLLTQQAQERFRQFGYPITVHTGDGARGYKDNAPYDRILVTAAGSGILSKLCKQLTDNGILLQPICAYSPERKRLEGKLFTVNKNREYQEIPAWVYFVPCISPEPGGWIVDKQKGILRPSTWIDRVKKASEQIQIFPQMEE